MAEQKYILTTKVHFGALKTSFSKGTIVIVDKENNSFTINDERHDGLFDVNLCIKSSYLVPYIEGETEVVDTERISPKVQERLEKGKMEVVKSNMDAMEKQIDIRHTKNEYIKEQKERQRSNNITVIKEDASKEARGLRVVNNDARRVAMSVRSADTDEEVLAQVNGEVASTKPSITVKTETKTIATKIGGCDEVVESQEGTVVKKIGTPKAKVKSASGVGTLSAKHSEGKNAEAAKARAESRKRAIAEKKAKKDAQ